MRKTVLTLATLAGALALPAFAMAEGGTAAGAVTGATAGAIVGGPVGAVVGGAAGAAIGSSADQPKTVVVEPGGRPARTDETCVTDSYGQQTCRSVTTR